MDRKVYIVAKIFDKQGCLAYCCKTSEEVKFLPGMLDCLVNTGIQIVILNDPEIYSEYAPYEYETDLLTFINRVAAMNEPDSESSLSLRKASMFKSL